MSELKKIARLARGTIPQVCESDEYIERFCGQTTLKNVIPNIQQDFFIPIIVNNGYSRKNNVGWTSNSWNSVADGDDYGWVAKLFITLAEDGTAGTPQIYPAKGSSKYLRTIAALGNQLGSHTSKEEKKIIANNTGASHYIDWGIYSDIEAAVRYSIENNKKGKRFAEHLQQAVAQENADIVTRLNRMRITMEQSPDKVFWERSPIAGVGGLNSNAPMRPAEYDSTIPDPLLPEPPSEDPNPVAAEGALEVPDTERIVRDTCAKIVTSLTCIPLSEEAKDDPDSNVNRIYIMRISVVDPKINVSQWIVELFNHCTNRNHLMDQILSRGAFREKYPHHKVVADTDHPVYNATPYRYAKACCTFNGERFSADVQDKYLGAEWDIHSPKSKINPANAFSFENCARICKENGGDDSYLLSALYKDGHSTACFPEGITTFVYPPEKVFWVHREKIGLMEFMFPSDAPHSDFYQAILHGENIDRFITSTMEIENDEELEIEFNSVLAQRVVNRSELDSAYRVGYNTHNRMVHQAADAKKIYSVLDGMMPSDSYEIYQRSQPYIERFKDSWISYLESHQNAKLQRYYIHGADSVPANEMREIFNIKEQHRHDWKNAVAVEDEELYRSIIQYEKFSNAMQMAQKGCLDRFSQLWRLDGRVDNLPISDPCKSVQKWFHQNRSKDGIVTRELRLEDPHLTFLATQLVKFMGLWSSVAKVVQPKIPLLTLGMLSCYDWTPGKLNFHIMIHGKFDLGKTFQLLSILDNFTSIPKTCKLQSRITDAATDSGEHVYDEKILMDEVKACYTSAKEQQKNPEIVNQQKLLLTSKQTQLKSFEWVIASDGSKSRSTQTYTTDQFFSYACVTNLPVEPKEALMSRFFTVVMKDVGVSVHDKQFDVNGLVKEDAMNYFRWNEYHSAAVRKAAMCGAIMPDVDLTLFKEISARMIEYLELIQAIPKDGGFRPQEIMVPYLRQLVYQRAIICTWDVPGGPHFNEPYQLRQIQSIQPYCYVDLQSILFTWTLLGSQYVDGNNSAVIQGACSAVGIQWDDGTSGYDIFARKGDREIPFRLRSNHSYKQGKGMEKDKFLIDLDYITIRGNSYHGICERIAEFTPESNKLFAVDVDGIFQQLSTKMMEPPRGGYKPLPYGISEFMHCYVNEEQKRAFDMHGNLCDPSTTPNFKVYTDADWPARQVGDEKVMLHVVEIEKSSGRNGFCKIHIAPWAMQQFKELVILDAFEKATMSPTFPQTKMISGWTHHSNPSLFQTFNYSKDNFVYRFSQKLAQAEERPKGCTRMDGITFPRHEFITTDEAKMLFDEPLVHHTDKNARSSVYKAEITRRSEPYVLINDLEYHSTLLQHVRCGRPLDEPLRTPTFIRAQYEESIKDGRFHKNLDYPISLLKKERRNRIKKRSATAFACSYDDASLLSSERSMDINYDDDDDDILQSAQTKRSKKGKEEEEVMLMDTSPSVASPPTDSLGRMIYYGESGLDVENAMDQQYY